MQYPALSAYSIGPLLAHQRNSALCQLIHVIANQYRPASMAFRCWNDSDPRFYAIWNATRLMIRLAGRCWPVFMYFLGCDLFIQYANNSDTAHPAHPDSLTCPIVGCRTRFWHLSHRRAAYALKCLRISALSQELSLHAYKKYGRR